MSSITVVIKDNNPRLPKGIALYRYDATEDEEVTLEEGDIVDIYDEADDGWWKVKRINENEKNDSKKDEGIYPHNYLIKLSAMDFYQLSQNKICPIQYIQNIIKNNNNNNNSSSNNNNNNSNNDNNYSSNNQTNQPDQNNEYNNSINNINNYNYNYNNNNNINNNNNSNSNNNNNNNNNNINDNNTSNHSQSIKDETHLIASLIDPMEKRSSVNGNISNSNSVRNSGNSSSGGSNSGSFLDQYQQQQLEEQRQQEELLKLQKEQNDERQKQQGITIKLNDVAKEGFLIKKGHIRRNWNVRWFQLKRNVLTYAKTPNDPKLSGTIVLTSDTEIDIATNMKRTNCFQIKNQGFVFYCSSQSPDDMESWIHALNHAKNVH